MEINDILPKLCSASGVSGDEGDIMDVFGGMIAQYCPIKHSDKLGNRWYESEPSGREKIMIEAHADKIGFMVSGITNDGFVLFKPVGGIDRKILPASRMTVFGKEKINGVVASVPPHLKEKQAFNSLCIDTGFSKEQLKGIVNIGDAVEFFAEYTLLAGDLAAAPAFDDRAALAVILKTLEMVGKDSKYDIVAVSSVQEEVGCRGARSVAMAVKPSVYVCIDVTHAATPDSSSDTFEVGKGPAIGVGPNIQQYISDKMIECCKGCKIDYQIEVMGGNSGTNAWPVQTANGGIPTGLVSVPVRYMHTAYEVLSLSDIENTAKLICELVTR